MKIKSEIVTCRFLPSEKDRLVAVSHNTSISTSCLARIAVNEFLTLYSVDEKGHNVNEYKENLVNQYRQHMADEWSDDSDQEDHMEKFMRKLLRMKNQIESQINHLKKENEYNQARLFDRLDEDEF
jgi:hypothetical protein